MALTSQIRYIQALDSTATDGSGKTGIAFGSITAKYVVTGGTLTTLTTEDVTTLGTYQAPFSAAHIRIKELSNADPTKGIYEVHFHNTTIAAAGGRLNLFLSASGARFIPLTIDLIDDSTERANGLLDLASGVETSLTMRQSLRLILAAVAGKLSGAATTTVTVRNVGDTKDRIIATVDASGNRSAVTADGT